jgi:putative tricarboxylic transport membrane protein
MPSPQNAGEPTPRGTIKAPQDFAAGIFLIVLALIGYFGAFSLSMGKLSTVGPGMLPKVVAIIIGAFGVLLVVESLLSRGSRLEAWSLRGMVFVLGAALVFAATIRPLGLAISGPLAVIISSFADAEHKLRSTLIFAVIMTIFCGLLFKEALNLPIPFDSLDLLKPLHGPYAALKSALRGLFLTIIGRG